MQHAAPQMLGKGQFAPSPLWFAAASTWRPLGVSAWTSPTYLKLKRLQAKLLPHLTALHRLLLLPTCFSLKLPSSVNGTIRPPTLRRSWRWCRSHLGLLFLTCTRLQSSSRPCPFGLRCRVSEPRPPLHVPCHQPNPQWEPFQASHAHGWSSHTSFQTLTRAPSSGPGMALLNRVQGLVTTSGIQPAPFALGHHARPHWPPSAARTLLSLVPSPPRHFPQLPTPRPVPPDGFSHHPVSEGHGACFSPFIVPVRCPRSKFTRFIMLHFFMCLLSASLHNLLSS